MNIVNKISILIVALTSVLALTNFNSKAIFAGIVQNQSGEFVCKIINS